MITHPITIATWNLERPGSTGSARSQAILEQIQAIDADIWVLTETNEAIALDGYHSLATPPTEMRRRGERATMIWSRWPLQEVPVFPDLPKAETKPRTWPSYTVSSRDTSPAVCAIVELPNTQLLVYGTIITYFGDRGPTGQSKYNKEQCHAIAAHARDWQRLRAAHPTLPMIAAGDFNATCNKRHYPTRDTCAQLRNALTAADLNCLTDKDWSEHPFWIDHICVTPDLSAETTVFGPWQQTYPGMRGNGSRPVSDHQGIHVLLRV